MGIRFNEVRILFVHEVNWRRKVTFEIHELPELLSLLGHQVDFIDFPEGEARRGRRALLDIHTEVHTVDSRTIPGSRVRIITPGRVFAPPVDRLVATLTLVPLLAKAFRRQKYDAVFLYGVPTNGWQTIHMARRHGVPVLFRGIDVAHVLRRTRFARLVYIAERYVYRNCDHLSVNNIALREYCISEGAKADRVTVDYPGLDAEHFRVTHDDSALRRLYGISESDKVVMYMGTFFRFSGLDRLVQEFKETKMAEKGVKLLLVGDGELRVRLEELVQSLDLSEAVIFTGLIDYKELPRYMHMADIALTPFVPSLVSNKALPWKVVQYVAANLPVVSTRLEGLMGLFPEGQGVTYVEESKMWNAVLDLLSDPVRSSEMVLRGQAIVEEKCNWMTNVRTFESRLHHLIRQKSSQT
jgi:glycosyltransferase involved in cell wall biosynthesis